MPPHIPGSHVEALDRNGAEVKEIAWKAQNRLHLRYRKFLSRGKNKPQIVTAVGRELLGFIWAIGVKTEAEQQRIAA